MSVFRCTSAHKLVEINERFRIFARCRCRTVVDLAAAPGGFAQVALTAMHADTNKKTTTSSSSSSSSEAPLVVAVDRRPIDPLRGCVSVQANILHHEEVLAQVQRVLMQQTSSSQGTRCVNVVLHDGVSVVAGQRDFSPTYAQGQMAMSALLLASKLFNLSSTPSQAQQQQQQKHTTTKTSSSSSSPSPQRLPPMPVCFITKLMSSSHSAAVESAARTLFSSVEMCSPLACKQNSRERYLVAMGFRNQRWNTIRTQHHNHHHGTTSSSSSHHQRRRSGSMAIFCLPPSFQDCSAHRSAVWCCLGCGQTRSGFHCPTCQRSLHTTRIRTHILPRMSTQQPHNYRNHHRQAYADYDFSTPYQQHSPQQQQHIKPTITREYSPSPRPPLPCRAASAAAAAPSATPAAPRTSSTSASRMTVSTSAARQPSSIRPTHDDLGFTTTEAAHFSAHNYLKLRQLQMHQRQPLFTYLTRLHPLFGHSDLEGCTYEPITSTIPTRSASRRSESRSQSRRGVSFSLPREWSTTESV